MTGPRRIAARSDFAARWRAAAARVGGAGRRTAAPELRRTSLMPWSTCSTDACLRGFDSRDSGLGEAEAAARLRRWGPNLVAQHRRQSWFSQLLSAAKSPFSLLLFLLCLLSGLSGDVRGAGILAAIVVLSSVLRFVQEYRSVRAAERLQAMVGLRASVRRVSDATQTGEFAEQPLRLLVPGDIVRLSAGDMVPADLRLLTAKDLFVGQAALTGEAFPVEKSPQAAVAEVADELAAPNLCFMGCNIISGSATAVVLATGAQTYLGQFSDVLQQARAPTDFDRSIAHVSWLLVRFTAVMVPLVLLINGLSKHDWQQALLFAIAVAVGLTPEMLPMIVSATLARGAVAMSRRRVIVKRLDAIQNFGAMDILCTDKTGTLTQDRVVLKKHIDAAGNEAEEVLHHAYLNSHFQTGLKNLLDVAVLEHGDLGHALNLSGNYRLVDEIPFDFERRRMSVVLDERGDHYELICKGAVEEVLAICTQLRLGSENLSFDAAHRAAIKTLVDAYNDDGFRVIAVAYRELPPEARAYSIADETDLVLLGFIAFLDPPKDSAAPALQALRERGLSVRILTGDNEAVSRKICHDVDLQVTAVLSGADIAAMDEATLRQRAEQTVLFAKLAPLQKARVVQALRANGHVVGFLGDGINDAAALRAADIGISVDTAVDIAKESADIILLEKSLGILEQGVVAGRATFANIVKYTKMAASSNFGNAFSMVGASLILPFLPLLPLQVLVQNLLYDFSQTAIPFDRVDRDAIAKPQRWLVGSLRRFMLVLGPLSSLFDYLTFAVLWFVLGAQTAASQSLFQTGWFVEGLLSQTLIVHLIRTNGRPFIDSRAALPLLAMTLAVALIALLLPYSPLAPALGLQALPAAYFPWLFVLLCGYAALVEVVKRRFAVWRNPANA